MLNIVIPMAGRGSRFVEAGYTVPKPLIPVLGRPMTEIVINNLRPASPHRFIFLCLKEHVEQYHIADELRTWSPGSEIISVETVTEGAACTVLLAKEMINNDEPLMIANCDQWVDVSIDDYLAQMGRLDIDGLIMTMFADDPKWSYVRFGEKGIPCEVVEKKVVSNEATVGIYNYRKGSFFVEAAEAMIGRDLRVNGEFYVAPAYNLMIEKGMKLGVYNIGRELDGMYGLGVPRDLELFKSLPVAEKAISF